MVENFSETDIGPKIILHMTEGLYPNGPLDAIREYIQNAIDSKAQKVAVMLAKKQVLIEDDGVGMDEEDLRKCIQLAVSEKDPKVSIGYKGIGIYSALGHVGILEIKSLKNGKAHKIEIDLNKIKLESEKSITNKKNLSEIISESCTISELEGDIDFRSFQNPSNGTQIIFHDIRENIFQECENQVEGYLRKTIPLKFDPNFKYGRMIQQKIDDYSTRDNNIPSFAIDLELKVKGRSVALYRPYTDKDFSCFEPIFHEIKEGDNFFGIAWGCMSLTTNIFSNKSIRGFFQKKYGFSIGENRSLVENFGSEVLHNRYIGEFIILNNKIEVNVGRTDIKFTDWSPVYKDAAQKTCKKFSDAAYQFQEIFKAHKALQSFKFNIELSELISITKIELESYLQDLKKRLGKIRPFSIDERYGMGDLKGNLKAAIKECEKLIESCPTTLDDDTVNSIEDKLFYLLKNKKNSKLESLINKWELLRPNELNPKKIKELHKSITIISSGQHPTLMHLGCWAFFELLMRNLNPNLDNITNELDKYIGKSNFSGREKGSYRRIINNIRDLGNDAKHSPDRFFDNANNLKNDMKTLEPLTEKLLTDIIESKS